MALTAANPMCYPTTGYTPGLSFSPAPVATAHPGSPTLLSPSALGGLNPSQSTPFATNLTQSQGAAARAALGEEGTKGPGLIDYTADGITTLDHTARTVDQGRRLANAFRTSGGAIRAGVAGSAALEVNNVMTRSLRFADRGLGPLGVASGAYGVYNGVSQIADGKLVEGSLDTVGGVAGMVGGGAATAGAFMSTAAPVLGALASGASGVAAAADGVKDVYQGIRDGNTEQTVTGGVKTVAGGLLIGGAATGNPIAIGAGAVLYGGAVIYENREAIADFVGSAASTVGGAIGSGIDAVGGAFSGAWNWAFG